MSDDLKRGNLLWESSRMMLPEHREQLLERRRRQKWEQENRRPELDEQELERISYLLRESIETNQAVQVTYWHDRAGICRVWGVVKNFNSGTGTFKVYSDWASETIRMQAVLNVEIAGDPKQL